MVLQKYKSYVILLDLVFIILESFIIYIIWNNIWILLD